MQEASLPFWSMHPGNRLARSGPKEVTTLVVKRFEVSGTPLGLARVRPAAVRMARENSCILFVGG